MSFIPGMGGGYLSAGNILIGADTSRLRGQVRHGINGVRQELNAGAQEVSRSSQRWGAAFSAIGAAAKVGMVGVVAAVGAGIGAAIQFESAWAGVRKTLDATPEELAALRQDFRNLAKEIPVSVNELARIGETAGALGIAKESVLEFTKVVSTIGQTTNVTTDAAATALGQLSNVLKMNQADYSRFAATLVDLGNKGASTEAQILEITSRAGAAGGTIGLTTREVMAFASATANLGIEVEAGGSSLQNFFMKMNMIVGSGAGINKLAKDVGLSFDQFVAIVQKGGDPLKQLAAAVGKTSRELTDLVTKSGQLKQVADVAGVTGQEFVTAFTEKAGPALVAFLNGLARVPAAERQMVLTGLKMNDIRITRMLLGFAGNTDNLTNSLRVAEEAWNANTAATDEAAKRYETTGSQIGLLKNILQDYVISLGEQALPVFKALVTALRDNLPKALDYIARVWKTTLEPALSPMVAAFGELGEAIAGVFGMEGEGANWGGVMKQAFQGVANVIGKVADGLTIVVKGFTWLLDNPFGQVAARIVLGWLAVRTAISGVSFMIDTLNRKSARFLGGAGANKGFLNWMSFGLLGQKAGAGSTAAPEVQAARALTGSASDLSGSAAQLDRAARMLAGGGAPVGPTRWLGQSPISPLRFVGPPGPMSAVRGVQGRVARNEFAAMSAVQQAEMRRLAQPNSPLLPPLDPVTARSGVKAALAGAGRAILGGVSKVFWPLLIADLALEFMKEPLGDFIANNTQFKRAGAKMKEDFFGGLVALVQSWTMASDLRLAIEEATGSSIIDVGGRKFDVTNLRGFDLPDEDLPALLDPTVGNRGLQMWAYSQAEALTGALKRAGDETFKMWVSRVTTELERNNISTEEVDAILRDPANYARRNPQKGALSEAAQQRITTILERDIGALATSTIEATRDALTQGVMQSIIARTSGKVGLANLMKLTPEQIRQLGDVQMGVDAGAVSDTAAALQLGSMLRGVGVGVPREAKGKFPLGYDPAARGRGYQTPEDAAVTAVRQQRQNIADAQKALEEDLAKQAKDPLIKAAMDTANWFLEAYATQIRAAGKDEKKQKAVMDSLNDLMKRAGRETRFTEWAQVLQLTEEQKALIGGPMKEQIAAALKEWSVEAARVADPEGIRVFLEKWGPAIASADTKKERTALREKLNALIPGKDEDFTSNKKMMEWIAGVTEQGASAATAAEAEKEKPTLGTFFETLFTKGPGAAMGTLGEALKGSSIEAIGTAVADEETIGAWKTAGSMLMDALIAGINSKSGEVKGAVDNVLGTVKDDLPGSPVKSGPLKHPFLINAGKAIIGQIGQGMKGNALPFPGLEGPKAAVRGATAMGGKTQNLYATNLNILGPADEESVLARVAFLSNV